MNPPRATTVATVEPEIAPNSPQARTAGHAEPAGQPAHQRVGHLDELFDNGAGGHDVAAQDEEEHHHQREVVHASEQALGEQQKGQIGKKNEARGLR